MHYRTFREEDGTWGFEVFYQDGTPLGHGTGYDDREEAAEHAEELLRRSCAQQSMGLPW
ncbi:MAG: hypothetical protein ACLFMS_03340 [Halorhodospira sp.]